MEANQRRNMTPGFKGKNIRNQMEKRKDATKSAWKESKPP
jgi:hypothetical protein